jgi:8-oxo-(d)GTP phosphatase
VLWRRGGDSDEPSIEIAVIHRPRYDDWTIPKGKLTPGESDLEGAVREVLEETGFRVHVGRPLGEVRYMKRGPDGDRPKVVRYWAMEADGGSFSPTPEVDELKWVTLGEAEVLLTFDRDRDVLQRFVRGPALTGCVLVVRHASAGDRSTWQGEDRDRPLDAAGWDQAMALVRLLSRYQVGTIVSADYERCIQTVVPLAESIGVPIQQEKVLSETGYPGNETECLELLRDYGSRRDAVVICSQGGVIPDALRRLAEEDHVTLGGQLPNKKGSVWALTFDGIRLFGAEYFAPPRLEAD